MKRNMIIGVTALLVGAFALPNSRLADLNDGLLGYWTFDEGNGSVANDYSGNGNHGSIVGASWTTGKCGNALEFDGSYDYVDIEKPILRYRFLKIISLILYIKITQKFSFNMS